ncbi:hypothetical protein JHK82_052786 [Glycine max]|nr:hypothetical protein JHK86_052639 [Glycine max]KAG4927004.1 hypothetical protein JHK85_053490 [Glycine max]KAG5082630.1 hypothetical protein JHK84_052668 [Glycine max]KAG5085389.1 hypothetical protein JHK82_052786 [Glycine max]
MEASGAVLRTRWTRVGRDCLTNFQELLIKQEAFQKETAHCTTDLLIEEKQSEADVIPIAFAPLCLCNLNPQFYDNSCPQAQPIVNSILTLYVVIQPGYAAQILRLHFHSSESIVSEKESNPNCDSARGFIVIHAIKLALERACPSIVS